MAYAFTFGLHTSNVDWFRGPPLSGGGLDLGSAVFPVAATAHVRVHKGPVRTPLQFFFV